MRFYSVSTGPDPDALKAGFWQCGQLAVAGQHAHVTLAVPQKSNLDGVISALLGDEPVRLLQRDKQINLGAGLTMHLVTKRIALRHRGPVLAAYATLDQIKDLARSHYATDLIYLPWQEDELPAFQKLFPDAQPLSPLPTPSANG
jgi:hypothetical protein